MKKKKKNEKKMKKKNVKRNIKNKKKIKKKIQKDKIKKYNGGHMVPTIHIPSPCFKGRKEPKDKRQVGEEEVLRLCS